MLHVFWVETHFFGSNSLTFDTKKCTVKNVLGRKKALLGTFGVVPHVQYVGIRDTLELFPIQIFVERILHVLGVETQNIEPNS